MDSHLTDRPQVEDELRRRNRELAALNAVAMTVGQSLDLSAVLDAALKHSLAALNAEGGIIFLFDPTRDRSSLPLRTGDFRKMSSGV